MQPFFAYNRSKIDIKSKNRVLSLITIKKQHNTMINKIMNAYCNQSQCYD